MMSHRKTNWIVFLLFGINWHNTLWPGLFLPCWGSSSHSAPSPSPVLVVPGLQVAFISQPESWVIFQCFIQGKLTHEHWQMPNAWNSAKDKRCTDMKWAPRSSNRMETKIIFINRYMSKQSDVLRQILHSIELRGEWPSPVVLTFAISECSLLVLIIYISASPMFFKAPHLGCEPLEGEAECPSSWGFPQHLA